MPARALLLALGLLVAPSDPSSADAPARWRIGKPHRLKVTHTTRVRVEEGTVRLQVSHAKPIERAWPGRKEPLGVAQVAFSPEGASEAPTRSEGGFAWTWDVADPTVSEADYVSTFELLSADRELKTSGLEIPWADLPKDTAEILKGLPPLPAANPALREAVAAIQKKRRNVIDALADFTQWVSQNIAYAPGVAYGSDDLDAICKGRGGHCGHRATVFLALCQAAGIPARRVVGFALLNHPRDGRSLTGGIGADDSNRHVWVQVNLPGLGWVEVEPAPHGSPFALSYLFVLCPLDLQSRFVAATSKAGTHSVPIIADTLHMEELR